MDRPRRPLRILIFLSFFFRQSLCLGKGAGKVEGQIEGSNDDKVVSERLVCDLKIALDGAAMRLRATLEAMLVHLGGDLTQTWGRSQNVGRPRLFLSQRLLSPSVSRATAKRARLQRARLLLQRLNHINSVLVCAPQVFKSWSLLDFRLSISSNSSQEAVWESYMPRQTRSDHLDGDLFLHELPSTPSAWVFNPKKSKEEPPSANAGAQASKTIGSRAVGLLVACFLLTVLEHPCRQEIPHLVYLVGNHWLGTALCTSSVISLSGVANHAAGSRSECPGR